MEQAIIAEIDWLTERALAYSFSVQNDRSCSNEDDAVFDRDRARIEAIGARLKSAFA